VAEAHVGPLEPPAALHQDRVRAVHHDLGDRGIVEEALYRTETVELVDQAPRGLLDVGGRRPRLEYPAAAPLLADRPRLALEHATALVAVGQTVADERQEARQRQSLELDVQRRTSGRNGNRPFHDPQTPVDLGQLPLGRDRTVGLGHAHATAPSASSRLATIVTTRSSPVSAKTRRLWSVRPKNTIVPPHARSRRTASRNTRSATASIDSSRLASTRIVRARAAPSSAVRSSAATFA